MLKVDALAQAQAISNTQRQSWANLVSLWVWVLLSTWLLKEVVEQRLEQPWAGLDLYTATHAPIIPQYTRNQLHQSIHQVIFAQEIAQEWSWAELVFAQCIVWASTISEFARLLKLLKYLLIHQPWAYLLEINQVIIKIIGVRKNTKDRFWMIKIRLSQAQKCKHW